jgi:membrane protease YdiL (CAAX protease family)
MSLIIIMAYIIPFIITVFIFKREMRINGYFTGKASEIYKRLYKKPKRFARAMGAFPAAFGFGHGVALLTLLIMYLLSRFLDIPSSVEDLLRPATIEASSNMVQVVMMVFMLVIIAPVFEEFWVRGIMYDALKPYGTGMAIIISSVLFGLMHGNLYMLFYTTAYGLAFGYIRYATDSLLVVTILHAIVNSIGAITLLLVALGEMTGGVNKTINTIEIIFSIALFVMIIVGVIVFLTKIPKIRKYTFDNPWADVGAWKKTAMFFLSVPVVIMMILAFNEIFGDVLINLIFR